MRHPMEGAGKRERGAVGRGNRKRIDGGDKEDGLIMNTKMNVNVMMMLWKVQTRMTSRRTTHSKQYESYKGKSWISRIISS